MADELIVTCGFICSLGGAQVDTGNQETNHTPSTTVAMHDGKVQEIGFAADEAISIGADVTVPALLYVRNLDTTNFVEFSKDTGGNFGNAVSKFGKIRAGDPPMLLPLSSTTLYAKADTAAVKIEWKVIKL